MYKKDFNTLLLVSLQQAAGSHLSSMQSWPELHLPYTDPRLSLYTPYTFNSLFPHTAHFARLLTYKLLLSREKERNIWKKPTQDTHVTMQYSNAGPWLTVSTLFPLVPQSTNLSAVNNLSIHSLTFPSFQSTWTTSKNHEKSWNAQDISPQ